MIDGQLIGPVHMKLTTRGPSNVDNGHPAISLPVISGHTVIAFQDLPFSEKEATCLFAIH